MLHQITVICRGGEKLQVSNQLLKFCRVLDQIYQNDSEIQDDNITKQELLIISQFFEIHDFDKNSISFNQPLLSNNLQENIDPKSYKFLQDVLGWKEFSPEWGQKIKRLLDISYRLDCEKFGKILLCSLAIPFYVSKEQNLSEFANQWELNYPVAPMKQREIVNANKYIFDKIDQQ